MQTPAQRHAAWMDDFFTSYYGHRPVNATFIGVHHHDPRLPDLSEGALGDVLSQGRQLLAESEGGPGGDGEAEGAALSPAEALDRRLVRGFLKLQEWELTGGHVHRGNPSLHTGEAIFGFLGLFLTEYAPVEERVAAAVERMRAVPEFLAQARDLVREAPAAWTERAVRECDGALELFTDGVGALAATASIDVPAFTEAAEGAAAAFARHRAHLTSELLSRDNGAYAAGDEALSLHLTDAHVLDESAEDILAYAQDQMAEARGYLEARAGDLGAASPEEALAGLSERHPQATSYYARYRETWDEVRDIAEARELLTWPDFPIRYVPRPRWVRGAAPHLYFLFYRSPAAFHRPPVHDYLVAPLEEGWSPSEANSFLRRNNDGVIKLNHVVHHGGLGHHVQNWHAFRAESRVGRVAAVDCASRIAMHCGGTMAEGWACYATDLAGEAGALTPLEAYGEVHGRVRMAARAVVDVQLHRGRMTLEDAVAYYRSQAGMSAEAARGEAVKNSMFPGGALMYLMGTDAIHRLRRETMRRQGPAFDLRRFHDTFLSYGSVPVSLIAKAMTRTEGGAHHAQ